MTARNGKMDPNSVLVEFGAETLRTYAEESMKQFTVPSGVRSENPVENQKTGDALTRDRIARDRITFEFGDRTYRIDGFSKNRSPGSLSVTIHVEKSGTLFPEKVELYLAKDRERFVRLAARELGIEEEIIKSDLSRILPDLRARQDQMIEELLSPGKEKPAYQMSALEREQALTRILRTPDPLGAYALCLETDGGIVGERLNIEASILASVSRMLAEPLHVIYQAPSAAGKSTIMKAILDSIPDECKHVFTEVSPNAFFYFEEGYLVHKTIGIMEDFGIGNAAYSLKTLLTDGILKKASTMRDPETGLNTTKEYIARGPVQVYTTSNNAWIIEDLQNRALILILNATIEQTLAIHARQRRARTIEGLRDKSRWESDVLLLQNSQRLLRPLIVLNPLADRLTFPSGAQRTRRDFDKYLTLIEAHALLNQFNRPVIQTEIDGKMVECIQVTREDIKRVNPIARHIFAASLDDLGPITRKLLELIRDLVNARCEKEKIEARDCVFSRRDVREYTKWSEDQIHRHIERLARFEYLHSVIGRKGQLYLYRLDERQEESFNGLIDPDQIPDDPEAVS